MLIMLIILLLFNCFPSQMLKVDCCPTSRRKCCMRLPSPYCCIYWDRGLWEGCCGVGECWGWGCEMCVVKFKYIRI